MRILVVDDERMSLEPLASALTRGNLATTHVTGGEAGLARSAAEEYDLFLVAARLPDIAGVEVCRRLKAGSEHFLPVVLASHAETAEIRADGLEQGADDYLTLPLPDRELLARVKSLLRTKSLHDRVRQLSAVREQVVYTVSHDFRTPLVGIRGAIQNLLAGFVGPLTGEQREYLALVDEACQRLARLTEDMTRRARGRREPGTALREAVDLRRAAEDAIAGLRATMVARGIRLDLRIDPDAPPAWGDAERLTQVIANLLDNAVKFSPPGGRIRVETRKDTNRRGGAQVQVTVSDEGPGIARSDLERIFYPFEQVGVPDHAASQGTGLGLAMCRETVEEHGGRIWAESKPDAGARFHVVLPAAVPVGGAV
ncbi:MAG: ATP-binding protein [Planctomycetes bacterium]|jgi:signal transduction histidine kinase|nr:ATP-binding protein [Planctomycetota bacterium]